MRNLLASARAVRGFESADTAVRSLDEERTDGQRTIDSGRRMPPSGGDSVAALAASIKDDLRQRFERGERPTVAEYLARFPTLRDEGDRVVSLIYEEFCLLEEGGARPDVSAFCARYPDWRDSLISQLGYHARLSQLANPGGLPTRFPEPGEWFEEFRLEALLGAGGAGRVFLARDQSLGGRPVALKVSLDRGNEPSILGKLDHVHIMPVHSVVFEGEGKLRGLCMPYRPGLPLDRVIARVHAPTPTPRRARAFLDAVAEATAGAEAHAPNWDGFPTSGTFADGVAWIGATLARALAHAHGRGILHRDVKPANVLMTRRDGPQLLDFNLAHEPHSPDQARAALQGGTLPYMAPEQLDAFLDSVCWAKVGAPADLYSLGLLLRELLTGEAPALPDPTLPLPRAIQDLLDLRAAAPCPFGRTVPGALAAIVARCLAYEPSQRYPSAQALADDLERFLERRPLRHASNPSQRERLENWALRRRRRLGLGAVALVVLGIAFYRPLVRQFSPLDRRPEFLQAVALVESERGAEARALLDPLGADYPDSPLLGFYQSLALLQQGEPGEFRARFARTESAPDARTVLERWGRRRPRVADQLETIGSALLLAKSLDGTLAARAFELALRLDPGNRPARLGMALTREYRNDCATAFAELSELIRARELEHPPAADPLLSNCYRARARVGLKCAVDRLRNDPDPDAAERLARQGLADNERWYRALPPPAQAGAAYLYEVALVEAKLGLGEIAASRRRYADAVAAFEDARALSARLEPKTREDAIDRSRRDQRIAARLEAAARSLAARPRADSGAQPGRHPEDHQRVRGPGDSAEQVGADQTAM